MILNAVPNQLVLSTSSSDHFVGFSVGQELVPCLSLRLYVISIIWCSFDYFSWVVPATSACGTYFCELKLLGSSALVAEE